MDLPDDELKSPDPEPVPEPPVSRKKNPLGKILALAGKVAALPGLVLGKAAGIFKGKKSRVSLEPPAAGKTAPETGEALPLAADEFAPAVKAPGMTDRIFKQLSDRVPLLRPFIRFRKALIGGLGLLVVLLVAKQLFFNKAKKEDKPSLEKVMSEQTKKEEAAIPVKGFKVGRFNFEDSLNALGTIKGSVEFKLSFEIPGAISSINYQEGERYEEGALLVSLRQDDILLRLKRAQAEFNKAQTQTQIAQDKVDEHKKLYAMGAIPKTTLENVKLEMESSKFEAEAARLEVKANEAMLEKSNLYAPSAGMIGELNIEEGETVTPNTLLGTHISTEFVFAEFGVVERDVNKIALGQKARVFIDAYPDKTFEGVIENVAPVVAGTSRTATCRVRIENPDRLLLPGMFARIRILLYSKKNTLVLPTDAIQGKEGEQFVYVVHSEKTGEEKPEGGEAPVEGAKKPEATPAAEPAKKPVKVETVEKRAITVGYTRPDYSQIDAGVSEGEIVAISGLERLEDGKKVRLLETQEAEI